ncbi:hypothetical protein VNO80_34419 [Phaseolus coccineus]|uniref:Uncharacterized protein n=1 Tax=Phaseolus coccineus TaxID=3886 RepID=A0AAN9KX35_PHACN
MVHGILQFTPSIAFRYVLHRCKSRDIRCRESFYITCRREGTRGTRPSAASPNSFVFPWRMKRRVSVLSGDTGLRPDAPSRPAPPSRRRTREDEPQPLCAVCLIRIRGFELVQWTSHHVAGSGPPTVARNPNTSPDHSIGRSDGRLPGPVGQGYRLVEYISVARVRPRTSKGITDLLLPQTSVA